METLYLIYSSAENPITALKNDAPAVSPVRLYSSNSCRFVSTINKSLLRSISEYSYVLRCSKSIKT